MDANGFLIMIYDRRKHFGVVCVHSVCYIHCAMNKGFSVNTSHETVRDAKRIISDILHALGAAEAVRLVDKELQGEGYDFSVETSMPPMVFRFAVETKRLLTPQRVQGLIPKLRCLPSDVLPVVYAPVISDRVASLLRAEGIGYFDAAGNCWLHSARDRVLIERQGFKTPRRPGVTLADPFASRSSRIVRAMLSQPKKGWQVRELARHDDVQVSQGLAANVKRSLLEEGYAIEHRSLLYLRDPEGLLTAWTKKYGGPAKRLPLYARGDTLSAEKMVRAWCSRNGLNHALAGLSAAWRLAPETRYTVATVYVEESGFDERLVRQLRDEHGIKPVTSGENLQLWLPFDRSVFSGCVSASEGVTASTSPIQTYLDARLAVGRGEEAATAVFDKYLRNEFLAAAEQAEGWRNAT